MELLLIRRTLNIKQKFRKNNAQKRERAQRAYCPRLETLKPLLASLRNLFAHVEVQVHALRGEELPDLLLPLLQQPARHQHQSALAPSLGALECLDSKCTPSHL